MPFIGKISTAVLLFLLLIPAMSFVGVKDSRKMPEYCANCHQDPYYNTWSQPTALAHDHAQLAISCQTCHDRTLTESVTEIVTYVQGNYQEPLKERKLENKICLNCHEDYKALAQLTTPEKIGADRNPHNGHHGELNCGICHNMHRKSVDYCSKCHDRVTDAPGWVEAEE